MAPEVPALGADVLYFISLTFSFLISKMGVTVYTTGGIPEDKRDHEHETNVNYYCQGGFTGERVKGRDLQVKGFTGREGN